MPKGASGPQATAAARKPPLPRCRCKASAAALLEAAFVQLVALLDAEWRSIRSLNLGVRSGTAVIEDVLAGQMWALAHRLCLLAVCDGRANQALVAAVARLEAPQFQQLQVLLDVLGLDELCDYLRLMCCAVGTRPGRARSPGPGAAPPAAPSAGRLHTAGSSGLAAADSDAGGAAARQRQRQRAAAGLFELSQAGLFGEDATQRRCSVGGAAQGAAQAQACTGLRFAGLLPPGHILTKTAEQLQHKYEFEAALAAAAAAVAAPPARPPVVPLLQLPDAPLVSHDEMMERMRLAAFQGCLPLQLAPPPPPRLQGAAGSSAGSSCASSARSAAGAAAQGASPARSLAGAAQRQLSLFKAPSRSLEALWRAGRQRTTAGVLAAAHLAVHEGPLDAQSILLVPGTLAAPRPAASEQQAAAASRRGSSAAGSRPGSGRGSPRLPAGGSRGGR